MPVMFPFFLQLSDFLLLPVIPKKGAKGSSKEIGFVSLFIPPAKKRPCPQCKWPVDGPDFFDRDDTLKPGSWCQSGVANRANLDFVPVNGPQQQITSVTSQSLLQESLVGFVV